jgi:hypothetical protein
LATIELRLDLRGNPHLGMHLGFCDPRRPHPPSQDSEITYRGHKVIKPQKES